MSAPSFTPGPWAFVRNVADSRWLISCAESDRCRGYVAESAPTNEDDEANARLIAAAPELLEALQATLMACGMAKCMGQSLQADDPALIAARAAIAKAFGQGAPQ